MYHSDMCTTFWVLEALSSVLGLGEGDYKIMGLVNTIYYKVGTFYFMTMRTKLVLNN